ncbi:MAG: 2-phosphosulfolactate phosphatase [Bacteroidales bacterium]|nr:2-phosphosulfolactate phosphatase [Bacteroidales bacterium]
MHIHVYSTYKEVTENQLSNSVSVVIDVLRATTVITTALSKGALCVKTTATIEDALHQKTIQPHLLLGGERNAFKVPGFDFANSPLEYTENYVRDKIILLCTTNGTQAIQRAHKANILMAASFLNLNSIADELIQIDQDVHLICSGTNGAFSLDDALCAGLLIHELRKNHSITTNALGKFMCLPFANDTYSLANLLQSTKHAKTLIKKGLEADIQACLEINSSNAVPIWKNDGFVNQYK